MTVITTADKLKELKRELAQRRRVYPRLIEKGSLTRDAADRQCAVLIAVIEDYEQRAKAEEPQGQLI